MYIAWGCKCGRMLAKSGCIQKDALGLLASLNQKDVFFIIGTGEEYARTIMVA